MNARILRRLALLSLPMLILAACSLAGDITPPPGSSQPLVAPPASLPTSAPTTAPANPAPTSAAGGAATPASSDTANTTLEVPATRPSAVDGSIIYAQHCVPCHGATGAGDGPQVAQLPSGAAPAKFSTPDIVRAASPQTLFQIVTQGRMDKFMPPFADTLSVADRWNVIAYLYTLSTPQTQIDAGNKVYISNCARCHGEDGKGHGAEAPASAKLRDFSDPALAAAISPATLFQAITTGAGVDGHAFDKTLSEADRWAAVDFVRAFAYDYFAPGSPLPTKTGNVLGQLVNGTTGQPLPPSLDVNLIGFDQQSGAMTTLTATADAQGKFVFNQVQYQANQQFLLGATYGGIAYHSNVIGFTSGADPLTATLRIYEKTDRPDSIRIDRIHSFLLFEAPSQITIAQLFIFSNLGDRTFAPANGQTVEFPLPKDAQGLSVQDGQEGVTYLRTAAGFADLVPLLPGQGVSQVLFSYKLPYNGTLNFSQKVPFAADTVNVMVGDMGVKLTGSQFTAGQSQDVQGTPFQNYSRASLNAGDLLSFDLSGAPTSAAAAATPAVPVSTDPKNLAIGGGLLGLVIAVGGFWWWRRSRGPSAGAPNRDDLIEAIAELDDEYAAGQMTEAAYHKERAWLKRQLERVWAADGDQA